MFSKSFLTKFNNYPYIFLVKITTDQYFLPFNTKNILNNQMKTYTLVRTQLDWEKRNNILLRQIITD